MPCVESSLTKNVVSGTVGIGCTDYIIENILHNDSRAIPKVGRNFILIFLKPTRKLDIHFNISLVSPRKKFLDNDCKQLTNR